MAYVPRNLVAGRSMAPGWAINREGQAMNGVAGMDATVDALKQPIALALAYHGYKRTGSIGWALAYYALGRVAPMITGVVSVAQGFGKAKGG